MIGVEVWIVVLIAAVMLMTGFALVLLRRLRRPAVPRSLIRRSLDRRSLDRRSRR